MKYRALYYKENVLRVLDQSRIPTLVEYVDCKTQYDVYTAIKDEKVVGRLPVGVAAAYGLVLAADSLTRKDGSACETWGQAHIELINVAHFLSMARPSDSITSATRGMLEAAKNVTKSAPFDLRHLQFELLREANRMYDAACANCEAIGPSGVHLIRKGYQVLTHGGHLSTFGVAPALAPLYAARKKGVEFNVYVAETRPKLQGCRLTAWELQQAEMKPMVVPDGVVPWLLKEGRVDVAILPAERVAANGDTLSRSGTYAIAAACRHHDVPFYFACTSSAIDLTMQDSDDFRIDLGDPADMITSGNMKDVVVYNPVADVTPYQLITGLITDLGIISPVNGDKIEEAFAY